MPFFKNYFKNKSERPRVVRFLSVFLCILIVSVSFLAVNPAPARAELPVVDLIGNALKTSDTVWTKIKEVLKILWQKGASIALKSAVRNTLNTIAYDTATWAGSGNEGQKPQWLTDDVGTTLENVGDQAAGTFISSINDQWGVNLCEPSLGAKVTIGLGLANQVRPPKPDCTASEMVKNWDKTLASLDPTTNSKKDFLKKFSGYFDVQQNDLGISLSMQSSLLDAQSQAKINEQTRFAGEGSWLNVRNIAGKIKGVPGQAEMDINASKQAQQNGLLQYTGDALTDAANVFLNQLAITASQRGMRALTEYLNKGGSSGATDSLNSPNSGPQSGGIAAAQGALRKIIEPQFGSPGDFDILNQLTVCNTGVFGVGPTECVLDNNFRQAIADQKTVAEAIGDGSLKSDAPFGFVMGGDNKPIEPAWNQGYPYRSLIILRKYRIIPVGWELAAQYIQMHPGDISNHNNLKDLLACYDPKDSYTGYNDDGLQVWCQGLIDPTWVLKAPQNYCAKSGYGPQILNGQAVAQGNDDKQNKLPAKLLLTRADGYCGDEQSCIKENKDGSCKYFGYCTEDKRLWKFGSQSCDANYNTCQSFKNEDGDTVSYLKNSLQYCDQSQAGCEKYAIASADGYNSNPLSIWGSNSGFLYLNKGAAECDQSSEGCHQFYRIASGIGSNLLVNSDFEKDTIDTVPSGWGTNGSSVVKNNPISSSDGNVVLISSNDSEAFYSLDRSSNSNNNFSTMPAGFVLEPEISYTLSADVYLVQGDKAVIAIGRQGNYWQTAETNTRGSWKRLSVTLLNNSDILANEIKVYGVGAPVQIYVDNVKFEVGNKVTDYSVYGGNNVIYEKFMPAYLRDVCYVDPSNGNYSIKDGAPDICSQFARQCTREEASCDSYTKAADNSQIAAAVTDKDYCDRSCVGYSTFIQSEDNFSGNHLNYFIPATAKTCAAAAVGCEEFTNLASTTSGGEQKEYYSYLRQCVKPSEATCGDFYSWEGSQSQGQQLVKYSLRQELGVLSVTSDDTALCSEAIFNLPPSDPSYNPDCRQFYDKSGGISYHLYSRTITCTEDCNSYRLTRKNIVEGVNTSPDCSPAGVASLLGTVSSDALHWDATANNCIYCKNGGIWDDVQGNCVYKAFVNDSLTCAAADNGCSIYNGNGGSNSKIVLDSEFENSAALEDGWIDGAVSQASYVAGAHSYSFTGLEISRVLDAPAVKNASYVLTFLARAENVDADLSASLISISRGSGYEPIAFDKNVIVKAGVWRMYSLNLPNFNPNMMGSATLRISRLSAVNGVFIDSIKLSEIKDRYYLVQDSWKTPDVCDKDVNGNPYPLYMLGCAEYSNRLGNIHYLHTFDRICQASAVGCEAIVDTQNSNNPGAGYFPNENAPTITVPADRMMYAVYGLDKLCTADQKSCERLGKAVDYAGETTYKDTYLKNDPDKYDSIICTADGVGCNLFTYGNGASSYFKDPGKMVCEWRQAVGVGKNGGWGWFKKKVKRCNGTDSICTANKDCGGASCQLETADSPCPTEKLKTVGPGGAGNEMLQPGSDGVYHWAGACPDEQSGCSEYIDPVSDFSSNIIYNSDFTQSVGGGTTADGWKIIGSGPNGTQNIALDGNTLYILTVEGSNSATINSGVVKMFQLGQDNAFQPAVNSITVNGNQSVVFYTDKGIQDKITASDISANKGGNSSKIILRKAAVDYQLSSGVNKTTCNGSVNPADGCVYFNERTINDSGVLAPFDLNVSPWAGYGILGINQYKSVYIPSFANTLLKVSPDRTCNEWLACKSYVKDENNKNVCFDIANCNRLDDSGNCVNFPVMTNAQKNNLAYDPAPSDPNWVNPDIKNMTGYVKVGLPSADSGDAKNLGSDLLNLGVMRQAGKNVIVPNGDFESFMATTTDKGVTWVANPAGWRTASGDRWTPDTADSLYSVVYDPTTAQNAGINYPMNGKGFLRYNTSNPDNFPKSSVIYVQKVADDEEGYYLSFYINTSGLKGPSGTKAEIKVLDGADSYTTEAEIATGWILKTFQFKPKTNAIYLQLGASSNASGNIYIDDLEITPVLKAKADDDVNPNLYSRQICRIYPKEDSLACEYNDDAGIFLKGDRGYCLEYDRFPGNPNSCLLWWPIDKVKGSGVQTNQAKGYSGREPLYYCIGANRNSPYLDTSEVHYTVDERMHVFVNGTRVSRGTDGDWLGYNCNEGGGRFCQRGLLSGRLNSGVNQIVPLNYGKNVIKVEFRADTAGGSTFLRFDGIYHYQDSDLTLKTADFDFVQMFKNWKDAGGSSDGNVDIENKQTWRDSYGNNMAIEFHCGDKSRDNRIGVMSCDLDRDGGAEGVSDWGDGGSRNYLTNVNSGCSNCDCGHLCDGDSDTVVLTYTFYVPELVCGELAQVVSSDGQNKTWVERVRQGSDYKLACNTDMPSSFKLMDGNTAYVNPASYKVLASNKNICTSTSIFNPFGSANPPSGDASFISDPAFWLNSLPYGAISDADAAISGQMGQLQSVDKLQYLFAESYGVWDWDPVNKVYARNDSANWHAPKNICTGNARDCSGVNANSSTRCNCAVAPSINMNTMRLNGASNADVFGRGFVNLTFNSIVDSQQSPMASYEIDWGDNEKLAVTGADMAARPNPNEPHSVYHSYDYYDLLAKFKDDSLAQLGKIPTLSCQVSAGVCYVKPRVKITDNWGWCTEGYDGIPCPTTGVCVDRNKVSNGRSCSSNTACSPGYICADSWWETIGQVVVHEPGT